MTKKQQVKFGAITGLFLLLVLLIITLIVICPTNFQSTMFITILALAAAAFSIIIPGLLNVGYRNSITASSALGVFVIVFFMKPAQLSDFKSCTKNIKGTIYFGKSPMESANVIFKKLNQSTKSDNFGNFQLPVNFSSINENLKIQVTMKAIFLDTTFVVHKSKLCKSIDLNIEKYCVQCVKKDVTNTEVNSALYCSNNLENITSFVFSILGAGKKQDLTVQCKKITLGNIVNRFKIALKISDKLMKYKD